MRDVPKVRDRLQRRYGLKVLRIYLDNEKTKSLAVFSLSLADGEEVARLTASMSEIGLPEIPEFGTQGEVALQESQFRLPVHILPALKSALEASEPPAAPLWIRLSVPLGLLAAVPWERLLQPGLGVPVLRLPYHRIFPHLARENLDYVICFNSPSLDPQLNRETIDQFLAQIPFDFAKAASFHLFADTRFYPELLNLQEEYGERLRVTAYRPPADIFPGSAIGQNPWLSWIKTELGTRSADVVHFICHSYRTKNEGALAFAESPLRNMNDNAGTLLFARELAEFLNQVGAWSGALTSPPGNGSIGGMRMLQSAVARLRPGPVLLHDMSGPDSEQALGDAFRFLYAPPKPPPASPTVSLYCHPLWLTGEQADADSRQLLQQYTLDGWLGDRLANVSPPAWLASSQKKLEVMAEDFAAGEDADPDNGKKRARELVLKALADCAESRNSANAGEEDGEST